MTDRYRLASERQLGYEQGEALDRRLRESELADRAERLSRFVFGADDLDLDSAGLPGGPAGHPHPSLGADGLESEVERLRAFYHAVQNSRAWRLTQRLRGVVGRAW
jgi:hypothetical protein